VKLDGLIVFGEVRYCRVKDGVFESGITTSNVIGEQGWGCHLRDDQLELLVLGHGLSAAEWLYGSLHLKRCWSCAQRLIETQSFLRA
jgi:hypothetical protein